jgi:hypothetical protein
MNPTLPIIHLNGTSRSALYEGYEKAYGDLYNAVESLKAVEFNSRDYYPKEGSWETALHEREAVFNKLSECLSYLYAHVDHTSPPLA